jgi:lipid II:glycine glycyltransferase (peptidoglycan interpeptide bridge formation enzyme)
MTLRLDKAEDELLAQMHHKWRYNIRLAEKKGVVISEWPSKQVPYENLDCILPAWYQKLLETARRDKFLVRGESYFAELLRLLGKAEMARIFLAQYNGRLLGGILCTRWGSRVVYNYGASGNENRHLMFSHLLQWRAICWAKSAGAEIYDFRGVAVRGQSDASPHLSGLDRFKRGFGAEYEEYIGEYDAALRPVQYAAWRLAPKLLAILKKQKRLAQLD